MLLSTKKRTHKNKWEKKHLLDQFVTVYSESVSDSEEIYSHSLLMKDFGKETYQLVSLMRFFSSKCVRLTNWTYTHLALGSVHWRLVPSIIQLVKPFIKIFMKYLTHTGTSHSLPLYMITTVGSYTDWQLLSSWNLGHTSRSCQLIVHNTSQLE